MNWQFHFRNFDKTNSFFAVHHIGCGEIPWRDMKPNRPLGRPGCWWCDIVDNPEGGHNSVYVPSSWVVNFDLWLQVIFDISKEIADLTLVIVSEGEDEEAFEKAIKEIFNIGKDILDAALKNNNTSLSELQKKAQSSLEYCAKSVNKTPQQIKDIAAEMGLSKNFGFLSDKLYLDLINENNAFNNDSGWSIVRINHQKTERNYANHVFINNGGFVYYWKEQDKLSFWSSPAELGD